MQQEFHEIKTDLCSLVKMNPKFNESYKIRDHIITELKKIIIKYNGNKTRCISQESTDILLKNTYGTIHNLKLLIKNAPKSESYNYIKMEAISAEHEYFILFGQPSESLVNARIDAFAKEHLFEVIANGINNELNELIIYDDTEYTSENSCAETVLEKTCLSTILVLAYKKMQLRLDNIKIRKLTRAIKIQPDIKDQHKFTPTILYTLKYLSDSKILIKNIDAFDFVRFYFVLNKLATINKNFLIAENQCLYVIDNDVIRPLIIAGKQQCWIDPTKKVSTF